MKANRSLAIGLLLGVMIVGGMYATRWTTKGMRQSLFGDIGLRHNEIACSHTGVNPFDVWSHKVESSEYYGFSRPDKPPPSLADKESKKPVHAYPPWHTAFFWFYGWLPAWGVQLFICLANMVAYLFTMVALFKLFPRKDGLNHLLFISILIAPCWVDGFLSGNYGIFILGLLVLFFRLLEARRHVLAGFCWALMMIKPHVAVLLFWGLLFQRRYLTIGVAIATCLVATLWSSFVYKVSPVTLLLQVPEIGRPYLGIDAFKFTISGIAFGLMGEIAFLIVPIGGFVLCGVLSFLVRNVQSWLVRFIPALIIFSFWTYSQYHDRVIWALGLAVPLVLWAHRREGEKSLFNSLVGIYVWFAAISQIFGCFWAALCVFDLFGLSRWWWISRLIVSAQVGGFLICLTYAMVKIRRDRSGCKIGSL